MSQFASKKDYPGARDLLDFAAPRRGDPPESFAGYLIRYLYRDIAPTSLRDIGRYPVPSTKFAALLRSRVKTPPPPSPRRVARFGASEIAKARGLDSGLRRDQGPVRRPGGVAIPAVGGLDSETPCVEGKVQG